VTFYFTFRRGAKYCEQCVCMSVGLFKHHKFFCACYSRAWLGSSLMTVQYVTHFWFVNDIVFSHNETNTDTSLEFVMCQMTCQMAPVNCAHVGGICSHWLLYSVEMHNGRLLGADKWLIQKATKTWRSYLWDRKKLLISALWITVKPAQTKLQNGEMHPLFQKWQLADTVVIIGWFRLSAKRPIIGTYVVFCIEKKA